MNQTNNRTREEWRSNLNTALEIFKVVPDAVSKKQITMLVENFIDELLKSQREELVEKIKEKSYMNDFGQTVIDDVDDLLSNLSSNKENKIIHKSCGTKSSKGEYEDGTVDYLCHNCDVTFLDNDEQTIIS